VENRKKNEKICMDQWKNPADDQRRQPVHVQPLLDWTEVDIWRYIERENIPIPAMYFARRGEDGQFYRFRSLGCSSISLQKLSPE
jgi:3'-phosphoadenosine 5'-phosphosulfate sulfotransferase (PAPS reductase)/FAD synthetase